MVRQRRSFENNFNTIEFENKKDKINKDIDKLLELYMNENVPKSIRKGNIEEKLKEKEKE